MDAVTTPNLIEQYPLLLTKLSIPRLETELLARPHLVERLDQAAGRPIVVVTAPAGWGKTTLAAAWALQGTSPQPGRAEVDAFIAGLGATNCYIVDYLSEEVLARQETEIQEFLLKTSILERLCAPLCVAILENGERRTENRQSENRDSGTENRRSPADDGSPISDLGSRPSVLGSRAILDYLERANLFLVSLDDKRTWYRYHHLFRDFLLNQLTRTRPGLVANLHRRTAQWFAGKGLHHDAVPHAMAAKDYELAGRIIMQYGNDLWRREEYFTLRSWLEALPLELRERHPDLCLFHAWALFRTLGMDEIQPPLRCAEALLNDGVPPLGNFSAGLLRGMLATVQTAISALRQDLDATSEFARSALAQLPPDQQDWRYAALVGAGLAHHNHNNTHAAVLAFEEAFKAAVALKRGAGSFYGRAFASSWLARLYMVQGHLQRAKEIYQVALGLATGQSGKPLPAAAWALTGLGELYFQWNDLELSEGYLKDSLALSTQITPSTAPPYIPLARLAYTRGDVRSAKAYLAEAVRLAERTGVPSFSEQVRLYRAWLALQQGDLAALDRWIEERGLDLVRPTPPREAEYVIAARTLAAHGDYPGVLALIEKLLPVAEAGGRTGVVIELLLLRSLVLQAQGKLDAALAALQRAVDLTSRERYVRLFLDEGESMLLLLRQLAARLGMSEHTSRLLGAFTRAGASPIALNHREVEILRLLAAGLSNAEIAGTLFITVGTVKCHTNHLYSKLGVKNRGQAVARAREFQLISDPTNP